MKAIHDPPAPVSEPFPLWAKLGIGAATLALCVGLVWSINSHNTNAPMCVHGFYHNAYIYQILNGIIPPTSMHTIGAPAGTYWPWHALVALIVLALNITPPEAAVVINGLAMWLSCWASWRICARFTANFWYRAYFATLPLIMFNPFYGVSWLLWVGEFLREPWFGIPYQENYRGTTLVLKFFNYSAFSTAVVCYSFVCALLLSPVPSRKRAASCFALSLFACVIHPVSGFAIGLLFTAEALVQLAGGAKLPFTGRRLNRSQLASSPFLLPAAGLAGMVASLPFVFHVVSQYQGSFGLTFSAKDLIERGIGFTPVIPFAILGAFMWRWLPRYGRLCLVNLVFLIVGRCVFNFFDENQYKFHLLASYPASFLIMIEAKIVSALWRQRRPMLHTALARTVECVMLVTLITHISMFWHRVRIYHNPERVAFHGKNVDLNVVENSPPAVKDRQQAFEWIRTSTPPDSYVILWPQNHNKIEMPTIGQRRVVASAHTAFTAKIAEQPALTAAITNTLKRLSAGRLRRADYNRLFGLDFPWPRQLYLFARRQGELKKRDSAAELESLFDKWPLQAEVSFRNDGFIVFRLTMPVS